MSLSHYQINTGTLSPEERSALFDKIERFAFITNYLPLRPEWIEVFLEEEKDIEKIISFPSECIITRL